MMQPIFESTMIKQFFESNLYNYIETVMHLVVLGALVMIMWHLQVLSDYNEELRDRRDEVIRLQTLSYEQALQNNRFLFENQELILNLGAKCGND